MKKWKILFRTNTRGHCTKAKILNKDFQSKTGHSNLKNWGNTISATPFPDIWPCVT